MHVRIERIAGGVDPREAALLERAVAAPRRPGHVLGAVRERCLARVEHRQDLDDQRLGCPLRPARCVAVDPALVVLELGLHAAGEVEVLVAFGRSPARGW